jgi:hypothetical protein
LPNRGLDAAKTIAQCAQYTKRIVDYILIISKLDSGLLVMALVDSQPEFIAKHSVRYSRAKQEPPEWICGLLLRIYIANLV